VCIMWILYLLSGGTDMITTLVGPCIAQVYFPFLFQSGGQ